MITLYHAPRTRSVRILWLLEELGMPLELKTVAFSPTSATFSQPTPLGKLPVVEDEGVAICESGAILEYILERYGQSLSDQDYLLGDEFSGADIMMGFTLVVARLLGVLEDRFPNLTGYLARLEARPAYQKAVAA